MNALAYVALYCLPLLAIACFFIFPPRRAICVLFLIGWLFLPELKIKIPGLTYGKLTALSLSSLACVALFDFTRVTSFRPRWIDLPALGICVFPFVSSLTNGLGPYDGFVAGVGHFLTWTSFYILGRLYFASRRGLKELTIALFVGGLIYVPFCLIEVRLSPQMHSWVYGGHMDFTQTLRFGGYRPVVFMEHGLAVGMWMATATLSGAWLWRSGTMTRMLNVPMMVPVGILGITTVLCKSMGSLLLLAAGLGTLLLARRGWSKPLVLLLFLIPPAYMTARLSGFSGEEITEVAKILSEDRAGSLDFRLKAEDLLQYHAMQHPFHGWGGWGRNRPATFNMDVENLPTDGLWVIMLGCYGLAGLISVTLFFLLPSFLLWLKLPERGWVHPWSAPAAIIALVLILFMIDSLMNAMPNPFFLLGAGGLSGAVTAAQAARSGSWAPSRRLSARTSLGGR